MKPVRHFLLFVALLFNSCYLQAISRINKPDTIVVCDTFPTSDSLLKFLEMSAQERLLRANDTMVTIKNKKLIPAILAFPIPFGILGLHRIYLGTKPYMPFAYIGTLGGCFGILPLIDFINILSADKKAYQRFENNPKVFMWSH